MKQYRLLHDDCIEVMRNAKPESIDAIVTDPPYGCNYQSMWVASDRRKKRIANDSEFDLFWNVEWMRQAYRLLKNDSYILTFTDDQHIGDFRDALVYAGFKVKRALVWDKKSHGTGDLKGDWGHRTEFIIPAMKGRATFRGKRDQNILEYKRVPPSRLQHPTEKPVELMEYLISKVSDENNQILDPFMGGAAQVSPP